MQIKVLHKNIYKLSSYALSHEKLSKYRKRYESPVRKWEQLKREGVKDSTCQVVVSISRATFYRYKHHLKNLCVGIVPPTKRPRHLRVAKWGEAEKQLVLKLRRENPTYGKAKIAVLLRRDHGITISESTVGRILKHMLVNGLLTKSLSAPRMKRKRRFASGHAQPWINVE